LLMNTRAQYGDIAYINMAGRTLFLVSDPEIIKAITVTDHRKFIKSRALRLMKRLLGDGLITSEGNFHRRQHRLMSPAFRKERILRYAEVMVRDTVGLTEKWRDGQRLDLYQEMTRLSLGIATETLFRCDVRDEADELGQCLTIAMKMFERSANPMAEFLEKLPLPSNRRFRQAKARLDATVRRMIAERRQDSGDHGDLLSMILAARDDEGAMTDQQVVDEVITLFVGGHETTALTLTWAWALLAQNPAAEQRMYAEIDSLLGGREPTPEDVPQLEYTQRVVAETLRLYPPIYILARECLEDYPVGEYVATKGTALVFSPYVMHRHPDYWDAPERFNPDRWTEEAMTGLPRHAYIPFGAGPRGCIGEQFGRTEATLALAIMAQRFWFRLAPGCKLEMEPLLSLRPKHGLPVIAHARPALSTQPARTSQGAGGCPFHGERNHDKAASA
ncbi:MAG: cytochrome P450, partial [Candidatus Hydrogenedentales bacterium]